ncbi:MAG: glycoside hydrolase family 88 protein [Chitinophagaceae bacterium]
MKWLSKNRLVLLSLVLLGCRGMSQTTPVAETPLSQQMALTAMKTWPDSFLIGNDKTAKWRYDQGVILKGIEDVWKQTGDGSWFRYLQQCMDFFIDANGGIRGYKPDEFNIDHINNGKILLLLYQVTEKPKYKKAADLLRQQLREHPRTDAGGFWHKKVYPYQMWLDGLYMGQPFYAQYAQLFHDDTAFNDILKQFRLIEKNARDPKTGYLMHGYDESRQQIWADKKTGLSPHVWGRALGWYGMALVDVLDYFPKQHEGYTELVGYVKRFAEMAVKLQDARTGLWFDIPDFADRKGNYAEASASCMLTYTLAKATRMNYIDDRFRQAAIKAYNAIQQKFLVVEEGVLHLNGTVSVSGLGGKPYRDGSFNYYMSEPVVQDDPKGMGAFILCAAEMEKINLPQSGKGKTVLLDRYFNSEKKKDITGQDYYWHYVWNGWSNPGFGLLQQSFERLGASTDHIDVAPTTKNLAAADVFIIVDPDHSKDNPHPNLMTEADAQSIADWVKSGGVLWLLANDSANCDLEHFNLLASKFGIRFSNQSRNMVKNDVFDHGALWTDSSMGIFQKRKVFLKEISTLLMEPPAKAVLSDSGDVIMAAASFGKGTVLAVGDPWLYNEYVDGRRLPADFDNLGAARDLANWLLNQSHRKK